MGLRFRYQFKFHIFNYEKYWFAINIHEPFLKQNSSSLCIWENSKRNVSLVIHSL